MLKNSSRALGLIFPNSYDELIPELTNVRLMASVPFASRYRLVDFPLSSMVASGIDNISFIVRANYMSLMDHLGSGREWDLARKNGGLNIIPPFAENTVAQYGGRIDAIQSIKTFLKNQHEKYVVMCDANVIGNFDYNKFIDAHIASGADVSVVYTEEEVPAGYIELNNTTSKSKYYTLRLEGNRVVKIFVNTELEGVRNLSANIYIVEKDKLLDLVNTYFEREGASFFERDILMKHLDTINVNAIKLDTYYARISSMKSYFDETMKLLDDDNLDALFAPNAIYTKIRDDNPTRYIAGAKVSNTMAADGCEIAGEVTNSVLFRGVKIGKGAVVKNCILMQDAVVEDGAVIENIIADKSAVVSAGAKMSGTEKAPVYIAKNKTV